MQDKDKFAYSSPMKYISVRDIINHESYSHEKSEHIYDYMRLMSIDFLRSHKKLNYDFLPHANTINIYLDKQEEQAAYEFAKLHWLIHDFKANGVSFPPQGTLQKVADTENFFPEMHPGTFRWFAIMYNKMIDESIVVSDNEMHFSEIPVLSFEEYADICREGFIRERKGTYYEVEHLTTGEKLFTAHERSNHHDWIILKHLEELAKVFTKFTVYTDNSECVSRLDLLSREGIDIKILDKNKSYIPSIENFEGISVYIPDLGFVEDNFSLDMLFDLDIDLDVIYYKDTGVTIFNNGSAGCKRLLPQIVDESKPIYLKDFLWARRVEIK